MLKNIFSLIIILVICGINLSYSQTIDSTDVTQDTVKVDDSLSVVSELKADTVIFIPPIDTASSLKVTNPTNFEEHLTQNPTLALFKSLVVPGLGQIGNRRYVKATLFIGLETWFIAKAIDNGSTASDLRKKRDSEPDLLNRIAINSEYENYRDQRNKYMWFAGITIFVSMFDAFVDAHLSGRPDEQKGKTYDFSVNHFNDGISANLSYNF